MKFLLVTVLLLTGCRQPVNWSPDAPWSRTPITVTWGDLGAGEFDSSLTSALAAWNYAAGCQVLARAHDAATANVAMTAYDGTFCGQPATIEDIPGSVAGYARCSSTTGDVKFRVMSDLRSVFVEAEHELGHALGLAHDRSSLMQQSPPLYEPQNLGGSPGPLVLPSDADGAAVHARYCK
jgi:hypothetical protein